MKAKAIRGLGNVYQRKGTNLWWISFYVNGKQVRKSSGTDNHAEAVRELRKHTSNVTVGKFAARADKVTFDDLVRLIRADYAANGQVLKPLNDAIRRLAEVFGADKAISITAARIAAYVEDRLAEGYARASVNLDLCALRRMFNLAIEKEMLATAPAIKTLPVQNARQGFLSAGEFERLNEALPADLKDPIKFLWLSGWRVSEARSLEWREVDRAHNVIRLNPKKTKTREPRILPIAGEIAEIIERAASNRRPSCSFVFTRSDGRPLGLFRKSWASALKAAGLGHVLVHDFRRSTVRNLVQAGVPERVAMEFTGHRTRSVFDRYHIVAESDLRGAAEKLQAHLSAQPAAPSKVRRLSKDKHSLSTDQGVARSAS
jgi:integrase